ncbi:PREDICTED: PC-esterase domain-containing protein 1B-like [Condylura cristata]|uniref:PC-esterase domain-containing protein 1B-like n=1 Tax=Condylura cristata TaxID=143302 RepID=UPI000334362C|nr:PREDICTED: PC-esterase domain-containing protein 1B-like [Condylura cristata]
MAYLRACEVQQLLHNKFVVIMGDSIQRAVYKDLVLLLQKDCLLSSSQLKAKGELSFERDVLLEGGRWGRMHNGTHYREVRQFRSGHHQVRFYFLTRAYSPYVEDVLAELYWGEHLPDVVIMNSCLWDLSRYGQDFQRRYREDLEQLFSRLYQVLPESCLLVWNTAMPVAEVVSGGFLPAELRPQTARLREDVMEANFYSSAEASRYGFDVLDLHFHFRHAGHHRQRDGVHWDERAHRHLSQLLLAHLADAWGVELPRRDRVGRWIREGPPGGRPSRQRRQPRDSRGDPAERIFPRLPPASSYLSPLLGPSVAFPQARPLFPTYHQRASVPYGPPERHSRVSYDPAPHRGRNSGPGYDIMGPEPRQSPTRTSSFQHHGRRSPSPGWCPSGSQRRRRRRSSRGSEHPQRRGSSNRL